MDSKKKDVTQTDTTLTEVPVGLNPEEVEEGIHFEVDHDTSNKCYMWNGIKDYKDCESLFCYEDWEDCVKDAQDVISDYFMD